MHKIKALRNILEQKNIKGMIVSGEENIFYLTGIEKEGILLITPSQNIFLTYEKYIPYVYSVITIESEIQVISLEKCRNFESFFAEERQANRPIIIEEEHISITEFKQYKKLFDVELVPERYIIEKMRAIKTEEEINEIASVSKRLDIVLEEAKTLLINGITEKKIYIKIREIMHKNGLDPVEVYVHFGKNTINHYSKSTESKLENDEIVNIEIIGKDKISGYYSQIGRTIIHGNMYNIEQKYPGIQEKYKQLYLVHDKMIRSLRNGYNISDVTQEISEKIQKLSWEILHYIGNSIGVSKKEYPNLATNEKNLKFEENMVMAITPEIFVDSKYGLIIKDTIQITKANFLLLTKTNREIQ